MELGCVSGLGSLGFSVAGFASAAEGTVSPVVAGGRGSLCAQRLGVNAKLVSASDEISKRDMVPLDAPSPSLAGTSAAKEND
jgi:hypothetical protein